MKPIPLTRGKFAQVDDEDFEYLSQFKWQACKGGNTYYAYRTIWRDGKRVSLPMHREILGLNDPSNCCDHRNRDGLDNRRQNLRTATRQQNICNRERQVNNQTGFVGVSLLRGKWQSRIGNLGQQLHIGMFETAEEAARARDARAIELHGEFACLNFPDAQGHVVGYKLNGQYVSLGRQKNENIHND